MTQTTTDRERLEAAFATAAAKLRAFNKCLTHDERVALGVSLGQFGGPADEAGGDVAGYIHKLDLVAASPQDCIRQAATWGRLIDFFSLGSINELDVTCTITPSKG